MSKKVVLLGSTGSIGTQCLSVCRHQSFQIVALTAGSNIALLEKQAREFLPQVVVVADPEQYQSLKTALSDLPIEVKVGAESICEVAAAQGVDVVVNAILGIAALRPTLAALQAGNKLALSNKEALIAGGELVMATAARYNAQILPVDSEHSAIWQSLQGSKRSELRSVVLTASGGPFFGKTRKDLAQVTLAEALAHPNWSMGAKITVDSATLMNKGLEFIEAMWLFDLKPEQIEVVVHRQSILHSAVDYVDGSVIAQLGVPDIRSAIQYAMAYPDRLPLPVKRLSLTDCASLSFEKPDLNTFRCLAACIEAAKIGGLMPCIVNGVNEQAVDCFLKEKISFLQIGDLVAEAVQKFNPGSTVSLSEIELADQEARQFVLAQHG